jgi:predicted nucleotide-binding protein
MRAALEAKLKFTPQHINRLIAKRSNEQFLTRRLAALSLARDSGINIGRYASDEEMAALRGIEAQAITDPAPAAPAPRVLPSRTRAAVERTTARDKPRPRPKPKDDRKVIVIHGRDKRIRDSLFRLLRAIGLDPIEWGQGMKATGKAQPSIPETVDAAFREGAAVVVLLTPDDLVTLAPRLRRANEPKIEMIRMGQARPNVLFEAGLAFGMFPNATVLVRVGDVKPFSDVSGLHITRLSNSPQSRSELIEKLRLAGAAVDVEGKVDWYTEGDFEIEES